MNNVVRLKKNFKILHKLQSGKEGNRIKICLLCLQTWLHYLKIRFNPLPNKKILDWTKLKAFADDNSSNVIQMAQYFHDRVEKIVGKRENVGYQNFLLFP